MAAPPVAISATDLDLQAVAWHTVDPSDATLRWGVDPTVGLSASEAAHRRERHGPNRLAETKRRPAVLRLLDQFRNFLILILLTAAVVSLFVSDSLTTPIVIAAVVVLNAVLGFVQEGRAERSLDALRQMLVVVARVRRDGLVAELPADQLVPGDIVLVEAGDRVPADGRLLFAANLEIEEAALTGESVPVAKAVPALAAVDLPLGDRPCMAYMNTVVTRGRGELLVTATGMNTEVGTIAGLLRETVVDKTPLQKQLDHVGHVLAALAGGIVAMVFVIGLLRGQSFGDLFLTAVALAVASVPEGLPAVVAVTLAVGAYQMARRNAVVKQLSSVETLGSTTVICSDKTGTLTMNQMTARALVVRGQTYTVSGEGYGTTGRIEPEADLRAFLLPLALCSDAEVRDGALIGDPTEGALVVAALKGGVDVAAARQAHPRLGELPFDSATKLMATVHEVSVGAEIVLRLYVKGAPDVLLARATAALGTELAALAAANDTLASQGLRVLALAQRDLPAGCDLTNLELFLHELTVVGLTGILDPPRPEAREAIRLCRRAGIQVKMITGDHAATATAIARSLGLQGGTITGAELDRMSDEELERRIGDTVVFARVAPEHKLRLVQVLRARGDVTAMTGDGVNDAPALRSADMGVAMGITGTEVTKEAATMVLADDNFATIVDAVRRGRTIYDNIVSFVRFQLSTTIGFGLTFLAATAANIASGSPFTALQILWVNIIMDGPPALAVGVDPPARDVMDRPPRRATEKILKPTRLGALIWFGAIMAIGTLAVMLTAPDYQHGAQLSDTVAMTMAFTTFVFFQFFNVLNARSEDRSALRRHSFANGKLWLTLGAAAGLHVAAVEAPFLQDAFDTTSLTPAQWLTCIAVASSVLWLEEARKALARIAGSGPAS